MKPNEPRTPIKHELEHAVETHIHDPEQNMNTLERWLRHALANPVKFWGAVGILAVVLVALSLMTSGMSLGRPATDEAWTKLDAAKTAAQRVEIAKEFPNTPAERWALLQAASDYYNQGFNDLPSNREVARPKLRQAIDLFEKVASESPSESPQARTAALGLARSLEAHNDRAKAIAQYEKVVKTWPNSAESRDASKLLAVLKKPEAESFYKELYAFKAPEATLPAGGTGNIELPLPSSLGGTGSPTSDARSNLFSPLIPAPPTAAPKAETPLTIDLIKPGPTKPADAPKDALPADVFTPEKPAAETPKK